MRSFTFTKMQGLGNDFIVVEGPMELSRDDVAEACDRRFGIGADGVLVVTNVDPVRMEYWNADGSAAEMCGNGLRCVARYAYDKGWSSDRNFSVATPDGVRGVRVMERDVEVQLGRPKMLGAVQLAGSGYELVDIGNPHVVCFVDDPAEVDVESIGSRLQTEFDDGANVEFVSLANRGISLRVWERGVGETMACGTGMAAAAAVAVRDRGLVTPLTVTVPGGSAVIDIRGGVAWIRGPAEYSFRGSVGER